VISNSLYDRLVGEIYDSAAQPELWQKTLVTLRDTFGAAYARLGYSNVNRQGLGGFVGPFNWHTEWDKAELQKFADRMADTPMAHTLIDSDIDTLWQQLDVMPEAAFQATAFYRELVQPNGLRDVAIVKFIRRINVLGAFSVTTRAGQERLSAKHGRLMERLSPHLRRALSIMDNVDQQRMAQHIFKDALDCLAAPVFLIADDERVIYANAAAERLLDIGTLLNRNPAGKLSTTRLESAAPLEDAVARALHGDAALNSAGIGLPLWSTTGDHAAIYVLPVGRSEARSQFGKGHAAVFVAMRSELQPAMIEMLRTIFDLSRAEARIVAHLRNGQTPAEIASSLDLSLATVRTHLAHAYAKTGQQDKAGMIVAIDSVLPPVMIA
jgi:DNA-binding CsgD family transcriptional regulator/PAS domain-containing protein